MIIKINALIDSRQQNHPLIYFIHSLNVASNKNFKFKNAFLNNKAKQFIFNRLDKSLGA